MNLNSADYWLHFFVDFFLAPKQQWEKFCDRNIGILLAQQIVTIHVGCWMPILLCFIIALSRAQLQLRELCISTAQALSQPQLHNYCLHERERERETAMELSSGLPLPSQISKSRGWCSIGPSGPARDTTTSVQTGSHSPHGLWGTPHSPLRDLPTWWDPLCPLIHHNCHRHHPAFVFSFGFFCFCFDIK